MAEKNPTIYDIANMTGVSPATVSRVLNEPDKVAQDKKQKVLEAIKKLNFVPKANAVAVARKMYKKICVIAPFFSQSSFMERLRGVESVLNDEHFEIVIYSIQTADDLKDYISMIVNTNRADGLIAFSLHPDKDSLELLKSAKFPVCFVESSIEGFDNIVIQNVMGGQKAGEFLYSKGCRNPGFIGEKAILPYTVPATDERFQGFRFFFASKGIMIPENHVWIGEFTQNRLDEAVRKFLRQDDLPDCVFCSSDLIAARFITLAKETGIKIPRDIKVLGFDDIDISKYIGLSSVSQSLDESGKMAAECVLNRLKNPERGMYSILSPIKVIERETT